MKTFKINGVTYKAKELTFNDICMFEDLGINLMSMGDLSTSKIFSLCRAYLSICMNITPQQVGELEEIDFSEVMDCFNYSIENSGFFRNLSKGAQEEVGQIQKKATK